MLQQLPQQYSKRPHLNALQRRRLFILLRIERRRAKIPQQAFALFVPENVMPIQIAMADAQAVQMRGNRRDAASDAQRYRC
ncbi:hypothetical protein D3C86_1784810 [compost metagenome]